MNNRNLSDEDLKLLHEENDAVLAMQELLQTREGQIVFKYLLKSFDIVEAAPIGVTGELLFDRLGFLRAGNSIFKLMSKANPVIAGTLLAEIEKERHIEKERYDELIKEYFDE